MDLIFVISITNENNQMSYLVHHEDDLKIQCWDKSTPVQSAGTSTATPTTSSTKTIITTTTAASTTTTVNPPKSKTTTTSVDQPPVDQPPVDQPPVDQPPVGSSIDMKGNHGNRGVYIGGLTTVYTLLK